MYHYDNLELQVITLDPIFETFTQIRLFIVKLCSKCFGSYLTTNDALTDRSSILAKQRWKTSRNLGGELTILLSSRVGEEKLSKF